MDPIVIIMKRILDKLPNDKRVIELATFFNREIMAKANKLNQEDESFTKLCRDGSNLNPKLSAQLKCRYQTNNIAFLKIAPFKVEEAYLDPYIVIFHDVIFDREIDELKKAAKKRVNKPKTSKWPLNDVRMMFSLYSWNRQSF